MRSSPERIRSPRRALDTARSVAACALLGTALAAASRAEDAAPEGAAPGRAPPNIILILADDLGIGGVGCYGADAYRTPRLDALAAGGARFDLCFSAPLCGPSRAMLMTGRYGFRTGVLDNGSGARARPDRETSIAKVLEASGYATAVSGKWRQLSWFRTKEDGTAWGFDEFLVWGVGERLERYWDPALNRNGEFVELKGAYGPDVLHEFAVDFIRRHRDKPFFLYYPMVLVHGPILRTPDSAGEKGNLAENIAYMDKLVGKLVDEVEKLGISERTLILFVGDNGNVGGGTLGGRKIDGGKGSLKEGGSRVPLIASWKGTTPPGRVCRDLIDFTDFFPTLAEVAGAKLPEGLGIDGRSFAPQLRGESGSPREWVHVQLGDTRYVRDRRWKLDGLGDLFDMKDAPFRETLVEAATEGPEAAVARIRLRAVLKEIEAAAAASAAERRDEPPAAKAKAKAKAKARAKAAAGANAGAGAGAKARAKVRTDPVASAAGPGGWVPIFDGKSLAGWKQRNGTATYGVDGNTIVGTTARGSPNSFLCTEKEYGDFELQFDVKVDPRLNSGAQIRSHSLPEYQNGRVHGYQVEIATTNAGRVYDEARRAKFLDDAPKDPRAASAFRSDGWNRYRILCVGDSIRTWVNSVPVADLRDPMTPKGFIGLQVHSFDGDPPADVRWRNIFVREIGGAAAERPAMSEADAKVQAFLEELETECLRRPVYTIGRQRAELLASAVREAEPRVAVECGTAIGYSGIWIARELRRTGGKLVSIEIRPDTAREAEENFRKAGLADLVTVKVGDAKELTKSIEGPIDLAFIDCDFGNYERAFLGLEERLRDGALVVSDNVVIGAEAMAGFLDRVRSRYPSYTVWFEGDLPWGAIDGVEVTRIAR